jgi:hypothetical protein
MRTSRPRRWARPTPPPPGSIRGRPTPALRPKPHDAP